MTESWFRETVRWLSLLGVMFGATGSSSFLLSISALIVFITTLWWLWRRQNLTLISADLKRMAKNRHVHYIGWSLYGVFLVSFYLVETLIWFVERGSLGIAWTAMPFIIFGLVAYFYCAPRAQVFLRRWQVIGASA